VRLKFWKVWLDLYNGKEDNSNDVSTAEMSRQCRMQFGTSLNPGKPLRENPAIVRDRNDSLRLEMPSDHPSLIQHSQ
jgi:hypothetical protein